MGCQSLNLSREEREGVKPEGDAHSVVELKRLGPEGGGMWGEIKNSAGDTLSLDIRTIRGEIIHLFRKYFLSTYYVARSVLGPWGRA